MKALNSSVWGAVVEVAGSVCMSKSKNKNKNNTQTLLKMIEDLKFWNGSENAAVRNVSNSSGISL